MAAVCCAHALGVAVVVDNAPGIPEPLGTCFECSVFGCAGHAEMDQGSGKWICFQSVASILAASAGIGTSKGELVVRDHGAFEHRFPIVASHTVNHRQHAFDLLTSRGGTPDTGQRQLLADAVGVARALAPYIDLNRVRTDTLEVGQMAPHGAAHDRAASHEAASTYSSPLFSGPFGDFLAHLEG